MSLLKSFVLQTANAPGTGTFSLIAPPTGRRSFASSVGAGQVFYEAFDGTSFEEGVGTLTTGAPDTLSRDTVTDGTSGAGVKINFASTVQIYSYIPAARALFASADNLSIPHGNRVLSAVGPGVATTDGAQLTQIGWQKIGGDVVPASGTSVVVFSVDASKYLRFRMEWTSGVPTAAAPPYARFSQDGGANYKFGATDYNYGATYQIGAAVVGTVGASSYLPLHNGTPSAGASHSGWLEIDPSNLLMAAHGVTYNASGISIWDTACTVALTASPTNVLFGFVGSTIAAVRLRLLGWGF